jgi:hypothetical protein
MLMQMEMMVIINSHCTILYFGIAITIIAHTKVQNSNFKSWWVKKERNHTRCLGFHSSSILVLLGGQSHDITSVCICTKNNWGVPYSFGVGKKKAQHLTIKSIQIIAKSCVLPPRIAWGFVKFMKWNIT